MVFFCIVFKNLWPLGYGSGIPSDPWVQSRPQIMPKCHNCNVSSARIKMLEQKLNCTKTRSTHFITLDFKVELIDYR